MFPLDEIQIMHFVRTTAEAMYHIQRHLFYLSLHW
jgi:hypothetical protein